jgi:hypothetical protein
VLPDELGDHLLLEGQRIRLSHIAVAFSPHDVSKGHATTTLTQGVHVKVNAMCAAQGIAARIGVVATGAAPGRPGVRSRGM